MATHFAAAAATLGWMLGESLAATLVILKAVDMLVGLRVSREDELRGLNLSQHSEEAYNAGPGGLPLGATHEAALVSSAPAPSLAGE